MKKSLLFFVFSLLVFANIANTTTTLSAKEADTGISAIEFAETSKCELMTAVTLCVDLNCLLSATAPSVFGAFNGWNAGANPVTDPDGDGVFCATVMMDDGDQEYKFFRQEGEEQLTPGDPCTVTNFGFTNRVITVAGQPLMETYGWEVCDDNCGSAPTTTDVTLCVDLSCQQSATAPSVFGAFNGWNAGANPVTDPDGDGVFCATVQMNDGAQEYLFFTQEEGPENMTPGDPCTVTNFGFTNRVVNVAGTPIMETYGFETCDEDCGSAPTTSAVTLCVDLSCLQSATAPSVFGAFNGWNAGANPVTDPDGDGIFCATVQMFDGPQEYLFFTQEEGPENMTPGDPCTVTNFGFTNRVVNVAGAPIMETYGWETCDEDCGNAPTTTDVTLCVDLSCQQSATAPSVFGAFNGWNAGANPVTDPDGDGIFCATVQMFDGPQEYLFFTQEEGPENMTPGDPCTVTNFGFTNRIVNVAGTPIMETYGWETCEESCGGLPAPWQAIAGGIACGDGSTSDYDADTETFILESSGCSSTNYTADKAAYIAQDLCGNGEIIARLSSLNPFGSSWAGVTMRESSAAGSKKVALSTNLLNFVRREVRTTTNGFAFPQQFFRPGATWFRLARNGNFFVGYVSTNGVNWQQVLVANVNMSSCIQVGLFLTNTNNPTATATFDNVSVSGGALTLNTASLPGVEPASNATATSDFNIFPNPASSEINLDLRGYYGQKAQVELIDPLGKVVFSRQIQQVEAGTERLDLNGLSNGLYFVRLRTSTGEIAKRFMIVN